jgi:hypothetical protein
MQHSESFAQVGAALAKAQGAFPVIPRSKLVTVTMKTGGKYQFRYAPLETILEKTRAPLAENGLALVQSIVPETDAAGVSFEVVRTFLLHESGEWLSGDVPVFAGSGDNKSQAYASGVTYSRRYGVSLLLCVSADEDDDSNGGAQGEFAQPDYERQAWPSSRGAKPAKQPVRQPQPRANHPPADDREPPEPRGADPRDAQEQPAFDRDPGTGEVTSPYGSDLTPGQLQMCKARAMAAGLDDAGVLKLTGPIHKANVSDALAALKTAVNESVGGA